jgi:hypothetical protein
VTWVALAVVAGRPLRLSRSSHIGVTVKIVVRKNVHVIDKNT